MATALDSAYDTHLAALRQRIELFLTSAWGGLGSWRDGDVERFLRLVVPAIEGAQMQVASLTDAYLSAQLAALFGGTAAPAGVSAAAVTGQALRGVAPAVVYARPFVTMRMALGAGKAMDLALREGQQRLIKTAQTDLQLAATHTSRRVYERDARVGYYRRRLVGSKNCALCVIASTNRYRKANLMPIHPGCNCKPEALGPGESVRPDFDALAEAHDAIAAAGEDTNAAGTVIRAAGTSRNVRDYQNLIITRTHGEYGPVLSVKRHEFTGPKDVPS